MASIEEKEIGVVGYRPEAKEGCCWWTCNDQLLCSDPRREENWDEPAVRASLVSWSKEKNLNLTKKKKSLDLVDTLPPERDNYITTRTIVLFSHLQSGQGLGSDKVLKAQERGFVLVSQRGCH